jgi:hypothetical protein
VRWPTSSITVAAVLMQMTLSRNMSILIWTIPLLSEVAAVTDLDSCLRPWRDATREVGTAWRKNRSGSDFEGDFEGDYYPLVR